MIGGYVCLQGLYNSSSNILLPGFGPVGVACFATGFWEMMDSQVLQWQNNVDFYVDLKAEFNLVLRVPDPYTLQSGINQQPMDYTDALGRVLGNGGLTQFNAYARMYLNDGTYHYNPTAAWAAVASLDLFKPNVGQNLVLMDWNWAQFLGQGACHSLYQGETIYDTVAGMKLTQKWVSFFYDHQRILTRDMIHVRRVDSRSYDCLMHAEPGIDANERAFGTVFNPTSRTLNVTVPVPLYYANFSIGDTVILTRSDVRPASRTYVLDDIYTIYVEMIMPKMSYMHFAVTSIDMAAVRPPKLDATPFVNAVLSDEEQLQLDA